MENPLVSIVIPVYNVEKYLNKCLDSVINQTYQNIEILLIDDGSVDQSKEISMSYAEKDSRIRFISKENEGQGATRNLGVQIAKGEYLAFLDSDDWMDLSFVEKMVEAALHFETDIVTCDISYDYLDECGVKETNSRLRLARFEVICPMEDKSVINKGRAFLWGKLFEMEFFKGLQLSQPNHPYEDLCIMPLVFAKSKKIVHIPEPLIHYLRNRTNNTVDNVEYLFFISKALYKLAENFRKENLFESYFEELKMFSYSQVRVALKKHAQHSSDESSFKKLQNDLYELMDLNYPEWINFFEMKYLVVGPVELKNACLNLLLNDEKLAHICCESHLKDFYDIDLIVVDGANKDVLSQIEYAPTTNIIFMDCSLSEMNSDTMSWDLSDLIFYRLNTRETVTC